MLSASKWYQPTIFLTRASYWVLGSKTPQRAVGFCVVCEHPTTTTLVEVSVTHPKPQLMLHAAEVHRNASAGNRARVTSMATMYSTTRPLMPCYLLPSLCSMHTPPPPLPPAVKAAVKREMPRNTPSHRRLGPTS